MDRRATGSTPPLSAFAVPHKRGRPRIPALRGLLKPGPDLLRAVRVLPVERPALEPTLYRLRHVQPAAAHVRGEHANAWGLGSGRVRFRAHGKRVGWCRSWYGV